LFERLGGREQIEPAIHLFDARNLPGAASNVAARQLRGFDGSQIQSGPFVRHRSVRRGAVYLDAAHAQTTRRGKQFHLLFLLEPSPETAFPLPGSKTLMEKRGSMGSRK